MNVTISIGDEIAVSIEDESEPNLEALETLLRRVGDEALRLHTQLTMIDLARQAAEHTLNDNGDNT